MQYWQALASSIICNFGTMFLTTIASIEIRLSMPNMPPQFLEDMQRP